MFIRLGGTEERRPRRHALLKLLQEQHHGVFASTQSQGYPNDRISKISRYFSMQGWCTCPSSPLLDQESNETVSLLWIYPILWFSLFVILWRFRNETLEALLKLEVLSIKVMQSQQDIQIATRISSRIFNFCFKWIFPCENLMSSCQCNKSALSRWIPTKVTTSPRKLNPARIMRLERFLFSSPVVTSSSRLHLGREVGQIDPERKDLIESMLQRNLAAALIKPGQVGLAWSENPLSQFLRRTRSSSSTSSSSSSSKRKRARTSSSGKVGRSRKIKFEKESFDSVMDSIRSCQETSLAFDHQHFLGDLGFENPKYKTYSKALAETFASRRHLLSISLQDCHLDDVFVETLCSSILAGSLKSLKILNLNGNSISSLSLKALGSILRKGFLPRTNPKERLELEELHVKDQKAWELNEELEKDFIDSLSFNSKLKVCSIDIKSPNLVILLNRFLARNSTCSLEEVMTPIEARIHRISFQLMESSSTPDELIKSDSEIEDELFELDNDFEFKMMSRESRLLFASSLAKNRKMKTLKLVNCNVDDEFAMALALALEKNVKLKTLDLSRNHIGRRGLLALAGSLVKNKTLIHVYLQDQTQDDWLSEADEKEIAACIEANLVLLILNIDLITIPAGDAVERSIRRNCINALHTWNLTDASTFSISEETLESY